MTPLVATAAVGVVVMVAVCQQLPIAHSLSEFRDKFPNGYNLADKEFGHVADNTRGQSSEGGSDVGNIITFGHNQLGRDYAAAEDVWTTTLCATDSDGDGQSNGLELGDPCCQWQQANYLGEGVANFSQIDISSPGRSYYTTGRSPGPSATCPDVHGRECETFQWHMISTTTKPIHEPNEQAPTPLTTAEIPMCAVAIDNRHVFVLSFSSDNQAEAVAWIGDVDTNNHTVVWTTVQDLRENFTDFSSDANITHVSAPPMAHSCAATLFDQKLQRVIVVGGQTALGDTVAGTWALWLANYTWDRLTSISGEPSPRHSASYGHFADSAFVFGGKRGKSTVMSDTWMLNLSASTATTAAWTLVSNYAPVPLDASRNPVALSAATGEALLYSESTRQIWRWDARGGAGDWHQAAIGWPAVWRTNATFVSAFAEGQLLLFGGTPADTNVLEETSTAGWVTSNRSIEPVPVESCPATCFGYDCRHWYNLGFSYDYSESFFECDCAGCDDDDGGTEAQSRSVTQRWEPVSVTANNPEAWSGGSGHKGAVAVHLGCCQVLVIGGCTVSSSESNDATCNGDLDNDATVDLFLLERDSSSSTACTYAPPRRGLDTNTSIPLLRFPLYNSPTYSAYTLLLDEASNYRVSLAWSIVENGRSLRVAMRAELPSSGYLSLAFVHPDWPIRDLIEDDPEFYSGKMYGADGVFGWFDDDGEGQVEAYGLPTYESEDIVAALKPNDYLSDQQLEWEDGIMTLTFTRSLVAPDVIADVSIDVEGSWIMWCLAPEGLFYPQTREETQAGNLAVMVTHTERHEAFITWDGGQYLSMDTTPRPLATCFGEPLNDQVGQFVVIGPAGNESGSCAGVLEGESCVVACTEPYHSARGELVCKYDDALAQAVWPPVDQAVECSPLQCSTADLEMFLERYEIADTITVKNANQCVLDNNGALTVGNACPLQCAPGFESASNYGATTVCSVSVPGAAAEFVIGADVLEWVPTCVPVEGYCAHRSPVEGGRAAELGLVVRNETCSSASALGSSCLLVCPSNAAITLSVECRAPSSTSNENKGEWSQVPQTFNCDGFCFTALPNASIAGRGNCSSDRVVEKETCSLAIDAGFICTGFNGSVLYPTPHQEVACGPDFNWPLTCEPVLQYCKPRGEYVFSLEHGHVVCDGQTIGDACSGTCDRGYEATNTDAGTEAVIDTPAFLAECGAGSGLDGVWAFDETVSCTKIDLFCEQLIPDPVATQNISSAASGILSQSALDPLLRCNNRSLGESCETYCKPGYGTERPGSVRSANGELQLANTFSCNELREWEVDSDGWFNCTKIEQFCPDAPPQQLTDSNAVVRCDSGSALGDRCVAECASGYRRKVLSGAEEILVSEAWCGADAQWTTMEGIDCEPIENFCPAAMSVSVSVDGLETIQQVECFDRTVGDSCSAFCPDGTEGDSKVGTCLFTRVTVVLHTTENATETAETATVIQGTWDVPAATLRCSSVVEENALRDSALPGFVAINGDGGRQLGLSWGFVEGNRDPPFTHPYGYVTFVLKTQQSYGYLGIGFGEVEVLMIPGDGVWGWIGDDGGAVVAYRMVSYVTQEIEDEGLIADSSGYLADSSMSQDQGILALNCTLPLNLTNSASGGEVIVPILADGTLTHFQWALSDNSIGVTMHTEWGSLDIDLSSFNSTAELTGDGDDSSDSGAMYAALGAWLGTVLATAVLLKALNVSGGRQQQQSRLRRKNALVRFCNFPLGHLCECCRVAHYTSSRWQHIIRCITFDAVGTLSGWTVASICFYLSVAGLFAAVVMLAPITLSRSSGWLCIGVLSLLMFPVARKSLILGLFHGLPFEAAIGHHRILGRVFVAVQLIHLLFVYLKWTNSSGDATSVVLSVDHFGAGQTVPIYGWVAFAATLAIALFSLEWFRRKTFELFYYSHVIMFVVLIVVSAKHVGVLPSIHIDYAAGTQASSSGHETIVDALEGRLAPVSSWVAFWVCLGVPLALYLVDVVERLVLALNCCGLADVVVTEAKVCYDDDKHGAVVMLEVAHRKLAMHYESGQYCYLSFPQLSCAASHPFTIASSPGLRHGFNNPARLKKARASSDEQSLIPGSRMTFYIKALGNFTQKVCSLVAQHADHPQNLVVQVKGPYGGAAIGSCGGGNEDHSGSLSPSSYPCWILIGGGIGVTPLASILEGLVAHHLKQRATARSQEDPMSPDEHHVIIIWTARHLREFALFHPLLVAAKKLASAPQSQFHLTIKLFCTSNWEGPADKAAAGTKNGAAVAQKVPVTKKASVFRGPRSRKIVPTPASAQMGASGGVNFHDWIGAQKGGANHSTTDTAKNPSSHASGSDGGTGSSLNFQEWISGQGTAKANTKPKESTDAEAPINGERAPAKDHVVVQLSSDGKFTVLDGNAKDQDRIVTQFARAHMAQEGKAPTSMTSRATPGRPINPKRVADVAAGVDVIPQLRTHLYRGRPNFRQLFNSASQDGTLFSPRSLQAPVQHSGDAVCVFACGPWAMLVEAQSAAHEHGFHFHKEIFDL